MKATRFANGIAALTFWVSAAADINVAHRVAQPWSIWLWIFAAFLVILSVGTIKASVGPHATPAT